LSVILGNHQSLEGKQEKKARHDYHVALNVKLQHCKQAHGENKHKSIRITICCSLVVKMFQLVNEPSGKRLQIIGNILFNLPLHLTVEKKGKSRIPILK
jgi:hypothetical protein